MSFALIPGAGGVAWYWHLVASRLQAAGHEAIAIDLPGDDETAGLPEYTRCVADAIDGREDVVLVAQSLGGFTAPLVASGVPVCAIVLVNAMIPLPAETPGAWWENTGAPRARVAAARQHGYDPEFDLAVYFLHDVPPEVIAAGESLQRGEADAVFASACEFDSWPAVPIRVVAGADDRFFPVEFQRTVARERLGVEADLLPGGHLIALSQPDALASYLLDQAKSGVAACAASARPFGSSHSSWRPSAVRSRK
jgi:pimeloyl-ACP methyl ester carboxylesterase